MARGILELEKGWLHPDAPYALAADASHRLSRTLDAVFTIKHLMAHPPDGMAPEQVAQRNALLQITYQILKAECESLGDEFCTHWTDYKRMLGEI